jgi:hypothetical protein
MSANKIFKIYYKDTSQNVKILGYLNELTQIIPGTTGPNINGSISLYDFTDTTKSNSYIYLTNAEYTPDIYVIGFWFSVIGTGEYTLLNMLSPEYTLFVRNKVLSDSLNTFTISLTNVYNMCALIFEEDSLTKIVVNDSVYPLANSILIPNISGSVGISLGNDNNMGTKFNGYIGEIQLLNANSFTDGKFNIDELYSKLKYKKSIITPTLPSTTLPSTTLPSTTLPSTTLPSTTLPSTTLPSTTLPLTTLPVSTELPASPLPEPIITEPPVIQEPETTIPDVEADVNGISFITETTLPTLPTTTPYITTTTRPPIQEHKGLLFIIE